MLVRQPTKGPPTVSAAAIMLASCLELRFAWWKTCFKDKAWPVLDHVIICCPLLDLSGGAASQKGSKRKFMR